MLVSTLAERLTLFAEAKYGMGKHIWVVPPENVVPYFQVKGPESDLRNSTLMRGSRSMPAFSPTISR